MTWTSSGVILAFANASFAAMRVMSEPASSIALRSSKRRAESVVIDMATISIAWFSSLCFLTNSSEQTMAQAAPSDVGQHMELHE